MKDQEFYHVAEEWPQPPDDPCTLAEPSVEPATKPKEKKSNRRARKKMSQSLAGVTAAAVAAVVMINTISPKDFFKEEFWGDDLFGSTIVGSIPNAESTPNVDLDGEPCAVCGVRDCPYYILPEGMEGLRISYTQKPEYLQYDPYAMNGFNTQDLETEFYASAIYTETDERLLLRLRSGIRDLLGDAIYWYVLADNTYVWGHEEIGVSGFSIEFRDEKSGDDHVLHVYLAYSPSGVCAPEKIAQSLDMQEELSKLQFSAFKVTGIENVEIHVYSDLGEDFNRSVWECCTAEKFTEVDAVFTLGKTMRLQEGTVVHRSYDDEHFYGYAEYVSVSPEKGETWAFEANFYLKRYKINDMSITFAATSWLDLLAQWEELNEKAPGYGHQVCFPLYDLGETAANGITYQCYATFVGDMGEDGYVTYMVIPQQEPEILISFVEYCYPEEIEALIAGEADGKDIADTYEIFSQITLRG